MKGDSVKTAKSVYEQCDGLEFERSSALLDLRYVPNEQDFSNREVRDVTTRRKITSRLNLK